MFVAAQRVLAAAAPLSIIGLCGPMGRTCLRSPAMRPSRLAAPRAAVAAQARGGGMVSGVRSLAAGWMAGVPGESLGPLPAQFSWPRHGCLRRHRRRPFAVEPKAGCAGTAGRFCLPREMKRRDPLFPGALKANKTSFKEFVPMFPKLLRVHDGKIYPRVNTV